MGSFDLVLLSPCTETMLYSMFSQLLHLKSYKIKQGSWLLSCSIGKYCRIIFSLLSFKTDKCKDHIKIWLLPNLLQNIYFKKHGHNKMPLLFVSDTNISGVKSYACPKNYLDLTQRCGWCSLDSTTKFFLFFFKEEK